MHLSQMKSVRRAAAAGVLATAIWSAQARAQVMEQVPADALAVFKVNDMQKLNLKVAKLAKAWGLDEMSPELKDPLESMLTKAKMTKGINKDGDAALVIYAPQEHHKKAAAKEDAKDDAKEDAGESAEEEPSALVPVSDYEAFLGNFKKADKPDAGGGITAVKDPEDEKTLYVVHRGKYAMISNDKAHLLGKAGMKLSGLVAKEADSKDAVFVFNMPVVREKAIPAIKEHRKEMIDEMDKSLAEEAQLKPFIPVFDTVVNHALDAASEFLHDADGIVFSMNITDAGIGGGAMVEFAPDSKFGKQVAGIKPGATPLLAGLPEGRYFFFGGGSFDPKVASSIAGEWLDPVVKSLNETNNENGKKIAGVIETLKTILASSNHSAAGMLVPTRPMGQESLLQQVSVVNGDAKAIAAAEKKLLTDTNELMALTPQNKGVKTSVVFGEDKTIDGAKLQTYSTKMEFDKNDPQGMQAEQILAMVYGPNGISGSFGALDDKTFLVTQGVSDDVLKEVIASAKSGKDVLSDTAGVKSVNAQLPGQHSMAYYIALDNIVSTGIRYAQGFGLQVKIKLPQNLAPIGIAAGSEGSAFRVDGVIPTDTIQALISAGLQAYSDMQQGGKGGGL